jgi:hypothetical protein
VLTLSNEQKKGSLAVFSFAIKNSIVCGNEIKKQARMKKKCNENTP